MSLLLKLFLFVLPIQSFCRCRPFDEPGLPVPTTPRARDQPPTPASGKFGIEVGVHLSGQFTTVKAIYIRDALEKVVIPKVNATYIKRTARPKFSYDVLFVVGPFDRHSDAVHYENKLEPDYLSAKTDLPVLNINQTIVPFAEFP